jgi:predicted ATPase
VVILDNCEHVVDAAGALAVRLLDAAPELRVLCTSQVPLEVVGEVTFELAPLALADAVTLFTRRASGQHLARASVVAQARRGACADHSTDFPSRSNSRRREPRHCRSRRSLSASTTASRS